MNFVGIIVGASVFFIIGICHPVTIKLEYHLGLNGCWVFLIAGLLFAVASLFLENQILSTIAGAFAFSCFWGVHEVITQEKRVLKGWFPENPKRHAYYERKRGEMKF